MEHECKGTVHKVVAGDTLYKLSKMYGVRLIDILKENPYVNVYNLQPGDEICIPTEVYEEEERRYYTAKVGETLGSLVGEFDTDIADLMQYNRELYGCTICGCHLEQSSGFRRRKKNSHRNRLVKMG